MNRVRDRLWMWGHQAGSHNKDWGLPQPSRITPAQAAAYMGIPNLAMVVYGNQPEPPFDRHAVAMRPLQRVVWSIVGDSSSKRTDDKSDLDEVLRLSARFPNITGAIMDDFFNGEPGGAEPGARRSVEDLENFRARLQAGPRPLDLWVVVYAHQLDLPIAGHLDACDVLTFWTWKAEDLSALEENFARLERLSPTPRKVLGCYMWDYGGGKPMPLDAMQRQCELGREWLLSGRIDGMIFLASCICDLELDPVEWTREWIREQGSAGVT